MNVRLLAIELQYEEDVVATRQRARQAAVALGLSSTDTTAVATAVSEIVRNAFRYAGGGRVELAVRLDAPQALVVRVKDNGPGIGEIQSVLDGTYVSKTGMGVGVRGSQRLCDEFEIDTATGRGTMVTLAKRLPRRALPMTFQELSAVVEDLVRHTPRTPLEEVQEQNKELMHALDALRARQAEVERLNAELAETNRGVVALYAELDDRAESLRRASEYKSRFLSDMTHELRTPLNAVISLSGLLIDRVDGELTDEQAKQVTFIHRSASSLGEMVNDLLDLAKIEAGAIDVHSSHFTAAEVLSALRGMFRAITGDRRVDLLIEEPMEVIEFHTDERKLTQILRNLVSNALKFTESGSVRVTCEAVDGVARIAVADTGIGIAPEHLLHVFDDWTQIDSGVQRRVKGTGLGLPLVRKLTELLHGDVRVTSVVRNGTTFVLTIPLVLPYTSS